MARYISYCMELSKTIKKIEIEELDMLTKVINAYLQHFKEKYGRPEYPMKEYLKNQLKNKSISIFADIISNEEASGFIIAYHNTTSMNIVQNKINENSNESNFLINQEKELFNVGFNFLSKKFNSASIGGEITEDLKKYIRNLNFKAFNRARMNITKEIILALNDPELPLDYSFETYDINMRGSLADIIVKSHFNLNHPDGRIWRIWGSIKGCNQLIKQIESNIYGQFNIDKSRVLTHNGKIIGICFVTTLSKDTGYIHEIAISNSYKGKGLGKALLIHSIKYFIKSDDKDVKIALDVTIDNKNALNLYENIGFKQDSPYTVYAWTGE